MCEGKKVTEWSIFSQSKRQQWPVPVQVCWISGQSQQLHTRGKWKQKNTTETFQIQNNKKYNHFDFVQQKKYKAINCQYWHSDEVQNNVH